MPQLLYPSAQAFSDAAHKRVTLIGMSNVGKTRLASTLPRASWFHYSVDYRLATAQLRERMIDALKLDMMANPRLARHLREDALRIDLNVDFSNLAAVSNYLGLLGDPQRGGLPEATFRERQAHHRSAESAAIRDIPAFMAKSRRIYDYPHFVADASGSLCELIDPDDDCDPLLDCVTSNTLLVYIEADLGQERRLIEAARAFPKPLYYRPHFLDVALASYRHEAGVVEATLINPERFARWVFPRLVAARRPRYERIARHGCTVSSEDAAQVRDEAGFVRLIAEAIERAVATREAAEAG
jgi:hypothetical protein